MSGCNCRPADQVASLAYLTRTQATDPGSELQPAQPYQKVLLERITAKARCADGSVTTDLTAGDHAFREKTQFHYLLDGGGDDNLLATALQLQWIWARARCGITSTTSLCIRFRRADAGRKHWV